MEYLNGIILKVGLTGKHVEWCSKMGTTTKKPPHVMAADIPLGPYAILYFNCVMAEHMSS